MSKLRKISTMPERKGVSQLPQEIPYASEVEITRIRVPFFDAVNLGCALGIGFFLASVILVFIIPIILFIIGLLGYYV